MSEFVKVASTDEVGPGSCKTKERSGSSPGRSASNRMQRILLCVKSAGRRVSTVESSKR